MNVQIIVCWSKVSYCFCTFIMLNSSANWQI